MSKNRNITRVFLSKWLLSEKGLILTFQIKNWENLIHINESKITEEYVSLPPPPTPINAYDNGQKWRAKNIPLKVSLWKW